MQRTKDWMRQAEAELQAAKDLPTHGHWFWCCFTCQQAVEKAIKAIGEHFRQHLIGHDLISLLDELQMFTAIPENVHRACAQLNRHYIPTRYPNAFDRGAPVDKFFEQDAREAVQDAELVLEFARNVIATP